MVNTINGLNFFLVPRPIPTHNFVRTTKPDCAFKQIPVQIMKLEETPSIEGVTARSLEGKTFIAANKNSRKPYIWCSLDIYTQLFQSRLLIVEAPMKTYVSLSILLDGFTSLWAAVVVAAMSHCELDEEKQGPGQGFQHLVG
jgi:hypothetical protein